MKFVEAEGKREVEGLRKISRRRKEKYFSWMLCGLELSPWPLLKSILIVKEVLGAVFGIFWTSLGLAQSKFRSPPVGS